MFLAIDIGNTNITMGLFERDELIKAFYSPVIKAPDSEYYNKIFREYFENYNIDAAAIISVAGNVQEYIKDACVSELNTEAIIIDYKSIPDMKIQTEKPEAVGIDRLINSYAAKKMYKTPCIIVDAGTAITVDVVSKEGNFVGGAIMPGINIQLKALSDYTSKLPYLEPKEVQYAIGNNTEKAMLSGVILGAASAVDGLITQFENEIGEAANIILTGGHCEYLSKYCNHHYDYVLPNLTLSGIKSVYNDLKSVAV